MKKIDSYEIGEDALVEFAKKLSSIAAKNAMTVVSCAEKADLSQCGIEHGC